MKEEKALQALKLNAIIMDRAIRGRTESMLFEDLYWKTIGGLIFVYVEDYVRGSFSFRLFKCSEKAHYETDRLLYPNYNDEEYQCLYDSVEKERGGRSVLHYVEGPWYDDLIRILKTEWEEER